MNEPETFTITSKRAHDVKVGDLLWNDMDGTIHRVTSITRETRATLRFDFRSVCPGMPWMHDHAGYWTNVDDYEMVEVSDR